MADASVHESQAKHNYAFLKSLRKNNTSKDWQIIVAFYTALHIFDAELTKLDVNWRAGRSFLNNESLHAWRDKMIKIKFPNLYTSYDLLLQRSKEARYLEGLGNNIAINGISDQDVKNCIDVHLKKIMQYFGYLF